MNIIEKIKDYHVRFCIAAQMLISLFMLASSIGFKTTIWPIAWWFGLIYGWSGLVVAFKLSEVWNKDDE